MMKVSNTIFALSMVAGVALTTGTPISIGARALAEDAWPVPCARLPELLADATATHKAVSSAMDDWSSGATDQRANVENVQQELQSAKSAVPGKTAEKDQAATAVEEQEKKCAQAQADYDAAVKALTDKIAACAGHTDEEPCRSEINRLTAKSVQKSLANSNCNSQLNHLRGILDAAKKALDDAVALVASLGAELSTAMRKEESILVQLQAGVNDAHTKQVDASHKYLAEVQACNGDGLDQLEKLLLGAQTKRFYNGN